MGLPSVITTDQGKEFNNTLNSELMKALNIEHRLTTPYHPQANGLVERYNQTIVNSLAKFVQDDRETWDENLDAVVYSYNTAIQVSEILSGDGNYIYLCVFRNPLNFLLSKPCLVEQLDCQLILILAMMTQKQD